MKNKFKRIIFCIFAIIILTGAVLSFASCEEGDIYKLIENIMSESDEKDSYSFEANISLTLDIETLQDAGLIYYFYESLEVVPEKIEFMLKGNVIKSPALLLEAEISLKDYEDVSAKIYIKDSELFFELNDFSRIIIDIFWTIGISDSISLALFSQKIEYDSNTVLYFDITDFDLKYFSEYILYADEVVDVDVSIKYADAENFTVDDYDKSKVVYFTDIQNEIKKDLLAIPGYRYAELACVISTENDINYLDIMAIKETGLIIPLERVQINSDLSAVRKNPDLFDTADIIPLRYIFELLGKVVKWEEDTQTVFVSDYDVEIHCGGKLIGKTFYTNIQNVVFFDYSYEVRDIGEYIEFVIYLDDIDF